MNWPAAALLEDGASAADQNGDGEGGARAPASSSTTCHGRASAPGEAEVVELQFQPDPVRTGFPRPRLGRRAGVLIAGLSAVALCSRRPGTSTWTMARISNSTDDAFVAARQFAVAAKASGSRLRSPGRRQPACRRRRRDRPHRRSRLPRRARRGPRLRRLRRRPTSTASTLSFGVQQAEIEQSQAQVEWGPGRARFRRAAGVALRRPRPARRGDRPERPAIFLGVAPAAGGGEDVPKPR